jgi:hypothetical protein
MRHDRMHSYRKRLFPALRERRFVRRHRRRGHKMAHLGTSGFQAGRCYWRCDCGRKHWC